MSNSTPTYGVGPAADGLNVGVDHSYDNKSSVLNVDGSVTDPDGHKVFDPSEDAVKVDDPELKPAKGSKTPEAAAKAEAKDDDDKDAE